MPTLAEVRQKYPQYADMPDDKLADALHQKFYSDLSFDDFSKRIGYQSPNRMETDADVNARVQAKYGNMSFLDKIKGDLGSMKSGVTPIIRGAWDGVSAIPSLAADAGVGLRNALTGSDYDLPSKMSEDDLNTILPMPSTPGAREMRFGTSLLVGAKVPAPQAAKQAPAGFVKPAEDLVRQQTLAQAQKAGYVVPPATTNPTMLNKFLESVGGKIGTAQDAATKNQGVTNLLAKRAIGMTEDAPITEGGIQVARRDAGDAYSMLRAAGHIKTDPQYEDAIAKIGSKYTSAEKEFPELAKSEVKDLVTSLRKDGFSSDAAVDVMSILRDKASAAYKKGDSGVGSAYKSASKAIEDVIARNLERNGDAETLKNFEAARRLIAKTHSVESAFNESSGSVSAMKLGQQLAKGRPLSGELLTAAKFGQAFPKIAREITDSGSVRNTDIIMSAGAAGISKQPAYLIYPFLRQAVRSGLLSKTGQKLAVPGQSNGISPELAMAMLAATESLRK